MQILNDSAIASALITFSICMVICVSMLVAFVVRAILDKNKETVDLLTYLDNIWKCGVQVKEIK